jgi:putative MATE family efflux protein
LDKREDKGVADSTPSIARRLFGIAVPMMGVNALMFTGYIVDQVLCGLLPNSTAVLGGIAFADQVLALLYLLMFGLSVGTVSLISRAHGANDPARVNHVLRQSTTLTTLIGSAIAVVLLIVDRPLLVLLGAKDDMLDAALAYLDPMLVATPLQFLIVLYNAALRGVGNTRLAFTATLPAQVVNILLTWVLVLGPLGTPSLGVRGAAIGSVVGFIVNLALLIAPLASGRIATIRLPLRIERLERNAAKDILRIGLPASIEMALNIGSFTLLVAFLARIDRLTVAAHGVGMRIQRLTLVVGGCVSQATAALIGMALGRGSVEQAKKIVKIALGLSVSIMGSIALALVLAASPITGLFSIAPDSELHHYSVMCIRLLGSYLFLSTLHITLLALQQGAGNTRTTMKITMISQAIQIPSAVILAFPLGFGAFGVWLSLSVGMVVKDVLDVIAYRSGGWAIRGVRAAK